MINVGAYPGYSGSHQVRGLVMAQDAGAAGVKISGVLTGLEPTVTAGPLHVHNGYSCETDTSACVYGGCPHYYDFLNQDAVDAWDKVFYASGSDGIACVCSVGLPSTSWSSCPAMHAGMARVDRRISERSVW